MRKIFLFPRGSCLRSAGCIIYRRWYSGGERRRVSCLPWVDFSHFSVHSYEKKDYFFPSVEAGKMTESHGKWNMPLSLTCHHAATDGWHVHRFLECLQSDMDNFEAFL